ncbi:hypothetical protein NLG97_g3819 [Lecanicillium saksenae]|uniref:Uncharacterized protein n=1 Tax=Lecanicillium saksenae TaxID=468837 RepID=A0ACC1QYE3_9HYPO|nr:hypothetical protein NLG97_g3819 [Lecanicillium saksenae]
MATQQQYRNSYYASANYDQPRRNQRTRSSEGTVSTTMSSASALPPPLHRSRFCIQSLGQATGLCCLQPCSPSMLRHMLYSLSHRRHSPAQVCPLFDACNLPHMGSYAVLTTRLLCRPVSQTAGPLWRLLKQLTGLCAWTVGSGLFLASFAAVMGPMNYVYHLLSTPRLPFTAAYFGSIIMTLVFAIKLQNTILTLFSALVQLAALVWYLVSYFPMGAAGLRMATTFGARQAASWMS